ncbi:hypothetical protein SAMN04487928_104120 [Butyrivibrio proteoclasticus]|uniref:Uncharacterized protein n=1 Tax=Butyrivibrio proteoclasticus TaxID=43305 RepID=A0A1I5RNX0_9FIRM|nr:hypothetical protein [Butyrivibrio proteoclasticus]SFP60254.1 hypothetical protein SAMN04487928_104120 [Butyrivibrio proteoclasticus]
MQKLKEKNNSFIQWPLDGSGSAESLAWEDEQNHNAPCSPAMGFAFDPSSVQTQYTAVSFNYKKVHKPTLINSPMPFKKRCRAIFMEKKHVRLNINLLFSV